MRPPLAWLAVAVGLVAAAEEYCGVGGDRASCDPLNVYTVAPFVSEIANDDEGCFLVDTNYTSGWDRCEFLKLYGNGVITFSSGGLYQYADDIEYETGGGGGRGYGSSQGPGLDFFALRRNRTSDAEPVGFDWYELKGAVYTFGYYDCGRLWRGGAVDDMTRHYFCSSGLELYDRCLRRCGTRISDYSAFNFTSTLFGHRNDTATSQVFF